MTSDEIKRECEAAKDLALDHANAAKVMDNARLTALFEIAFQLAKINERFEADAKVFNEMVEKGKGLSA